LHTRGKKMYNGLQNNSSLIGLFNGNSLNISIEEIYSVDYNISTYQFRTLKFTSYTLDLGIIGTSLVNIFGLNGIKQNNDQLGYTLLTSTNEACASFTFLVGTGAKSYKIRLLIFIEQRLSPILKGFMSLPNQARSFDRFELFKGLGLPENKDTTIDYSVYSLKFLQKRNTLEQPCVDVDNYDKVMSL